MATPPSVPRVSVIVPAYNAAPWIGQTLRAIQAQSFDAWEVLVADDASTDDTPRIVADMAVQDQRIRLLQMPANTGGPAGPRNHALAHARAEWVAFCDSDDLWHRRKLELQLKVAAEQHADLVCTAIRDFSDGTGPVADVAVSAATPLRTSTIGLWTQLGKNVIPNSSVLCRRASILSAGGFDTARELVAVEDYDLWLRLLEGGARVVKLELPLVHYRRLPGSISANKSRLVRKVFIVLRRHFTRRRRAWLFPVAAPLLIASYGLRSVYLRVWRGKL